MDDSFSSSSDLNGEVENLQMRNSAEKAKRNSKATECLKKQINYFVQRYLMIFFWEIACRVFYSFDLWISRRSQRSQPSSKRFFARLRQLLVGTLGKVV